MSFLHGLSSHRTKLCLFNLDESSNEQDSGIDKNGKSTTNQQQQQQQLLSRTSALVPQANQQQQQHQQLNVRMRRHPELVPVMPRERDLGLSTGMRNNHNINNKNNGCSNSSSLTRPHLRANNFNSGSNSSSSSGSRNHPMSSSYMGQQQIFNKQHKDTFAKPQPKRCVSMTRLDQLAQPKRIFTKETTQPKPSAPSARKTPIRLKSSAKQKPSDSPDVLNQSTQDSDNISDSTLRDLEEIQPKSPASTCDNSLSISEIIRKNFSLNSPSNEGIADVTETSILSSVYHSPSSFQEANQESFLSVVDTTLDGSRNSVQIQVENEKNNKQKAEVKPEPKPEPKAEENEFLQRIKKEEEEKRLREEEELKHELRKEEEEREERKRVSDSIKVFCSV